jgi:hypothetical protein
LFDFGFIGTDFRVNSSRTGVPLRNASPKRLIT